MSFYETTNLSSIGLSFIFIMGISVLFLPRRLAFVPIIMTTCYITLGQQLLISVFHFSAIRIVILLSWFRLFVRGEISALKLNSLDKAVICWVISSFVIYNLQWLTSEALVNRLGFVFDVIGIYFLFRFIIIDFNDIENVQTAIAIIIIPLAIAMLYEYSSGRNIFLMFGGVAEIADSRGTRFRCQGPFRHPILAGTFGAVLLPLLFSIWFKCGKFRLYAVAGMASATIIMLTSASSGPLIASLFGVVALLMWPFRGYMSIIRWGILFIFISLHLVMKAPVWHLMARIGGSMGGTGWHRSYLIDQAIAHFDKWWFLGMKYTADWFPYGLAIDPNVTDVTNQYIAEGIKGGLLTLILFIAVIVFSFKIIGLSLRTIEEGSFVEKITLWSLGASLIAHLISFLSVTYFDQIIVIWYLLLAMISTIGNSLTFVNRMEITENDREPPLENFI